MITFKIMNRRLAFNIRGVYYETYEETLMRFPNTLLGNPALREQFCNAENNQFYLDRSHHIFDTILFFYQSGGILAKPDHVDEDDFQSELKFFGIIKDPVAMETPVVENFKFKRKLWLLFEYPKSSIAAKILAKFSLFMILISTLTYCLETVNSPFLKTGIHRGHKIGEMPPGSPWTILESIYTVWFFVEYILRFYSHEKKRTFVFSVLGLVDLLAIIPFIIIVFVIKHKSSTAVRVFKFLQIFRILKLTRYSKSLQLLGKSLYYCKGQISLLLVFFFINCFACGSMLYWIEKTSPKSKFATIMDTMWFCVISMTTVGYGDIIPQTDLGKVMGAMTILIGIVVLFHIFIPVYLSYFALLYELSILNQVEKETLEEEQEQKSDAKNPKKVNETPANRRPRPSVPRPSVSMSRSPSVSTREGVTQVRKQSVSKEETHMRRIKYDYLRKVSNTEATCDQSWKQQATDSDSFDSTSSRRSIVRQRATFDSTAITEDEDKPKMQQVKSRRRRKAVFEQPIIFADISEDLVTSPNSLTSRTSRSVSVAVQSPSSSEERKLSDDRGSRKTRKAMSLQMYHIERIGRIDEAESSSDCD